MYLGMIRRMYFCVFLETEVILDGVSYSSLEILDTVSRDQNNTFCDILPSMNQERTLQGVQCPIEKVPQLYLTRVGTVSLSPYWNSIEFDSEWRLYRMRGQGAAIAYNGTHFPLTAHQLILVPAWLKFLEIPGEGLIQDYLSFCIPDLPPYLVKAHCNHAVTLPEDSELMRQFGEFISQIQHQEDRVPVRGLLALSALHIACRVFLLYVAGLGDESRNAFEQAYRHPHPIQLLANEIIARPLEDWSVPVLASRAHCSREHFTRIFKRHLYQSPGQFIREQRLIASATLLRETDDSIEWVAERCGFSDRNSFGRAFSRQYSCSPSAYRYRQRNSSQGKQEL